jgi:hypothetical protein
MSVFNLQGSLDRAARKSARRPRSDRGRSRLSPRLAARIDVLLSGQERPAVHVLASELEAYAARHRLRAPARATIYAALARAPVPAFEKRRLPESVRHALHNLEDDAVVPGAQVAFAAFNRGDTVALCFAAGLPWSCLAAASRLPGFRPKSLALLRAVMRYRGI